MKQFVLLLATLFLLPPLFGKVYHLDPVNGDNSNDGSMTHTWSSFESVLASNMVETQSWSPLPYTDQSTLQPKNVGAPIKAGDTLLLMSGFHGFAYIRGASNTDYITVMAAPGHQPVLEGIKYTSVTFWRFENLLITPESTGEFHTGRICFFESHGYHGPTSEIIISGCTIQSIDNSEGWSLDDWLTKSASGIYTNSNRITIEDNIIQNVDHGISVLGGQSVIRGNQVINFSGDGIRPLGSDNIVEFNLIKNCYDIDDNHDDGIQVFTSADNPVERMVLRGNIILNFEDPEQPFRGPLQGIGCFDGPFVDWIVENNVVVVDHWHGITLMGAFNCDIVNNTVLDPTPDERPGPVWIRVTNHKDGTPSEGCRVINNLSNTFSIDAESINNIEVSQSEYDEYFVDFDQFDLHLADFSPAIDAGDTTGAPLVDIEGLDRPQGSAIDVGAYEYEFLTTSTTQAMNDKFHVFPNPSSGVIHFELQQSDLSVLLYEIISMDGQYITSLPAKNISQWTAPGTGRYLVLLRGDVHVLTSRIVVVD